MAVIKSSIVFMHEGLVQPDALSKREKGIKGHWEKSYKFRYIVVMSSVPPSE